MISMIWAPPIMVLIRDACPGQSTNVNCILSQGTSSSKENQGYFDSVSRYIPRWFGLSTTNAENPKSNVIPRSLLWGLLSNDAVDGNVLNAFAKINF